MKFGHGLLKFGLHAFAAKSKAFRYLIKHCSGDRNVAADILSREFPDVVDNTPAEVEKLNKDLTDTDETVAPSDLLSDISESEFVPISGSVAPIAAAAPPPILPHQRQGNPPPRQRRQARVRRQPDAPLDIDEAVLDDGLPVFDVGPLPPPPPRRITAEHYHILKFSRRRKPAHRCRSSASCSTRTWVQLGRHGR